MPKKNKLSQIELIEGFFDNGLVQMPGAGPEDIDIGDIAVITHLEKTYGKIIEREDSEFFIPQIEGNNIVVTIKFKDTLKFAKQRFIDLQVVLYGKMNIPLKEDENYSSDPIFIVEKITLTNMNHGPNHYKTTSTLIQGFTI